MTASVAAILIALVVLVVAVLPAEYGIDPLGTGKALGLLQLAQASAAPPAAATDGATYSIAPVAEPSPESNSAKIRNSFLSQPSRYKTDSRVIKLPPGSGTEIKYNMKRGAGLIYSWTATGPVMFEFHGEPDKKPEGKGGTDYYESYELDDKKGVDQSHGTFLAPSTGIHGWFWENKTDKEVSVTLVTAGFYDFIIQFTGDGKANTVQPLDPPIVPGR